MNATRTIELIGRYEGERFRFNNPSGSVLIGSIKLINGSKEIAQEHGIDNPHSSITIKGDDDFGLEPSNTYRFLGVFHNYQNPRSKTTEKQFCFRTFIAHVPNDPEGIARYLVDNGRGNGIGPAKARRLVDTFGTDDVLTICRNEPERVSTAISIDLEMAQRFADKLEQNKKTESSKIEIDALLSGHGFPKSLGNKLLKQWGCNAAKIAVDEPFRLMEFKGVGFRLADKFYMELGKDPAAIERQALCMWYSMSSDQAGHSWFPGEEQVKKLRGAIGDKADYKEAIRHGLAASVVKDDPFGALASIRTDGPDGPISEKGTTFWLAEGKVASQEKRLAELIADAMAEPKARTITVYLDEEIIETIPAQYMRCHRCGRALTADTVFVLNGLPYGPTCVEKI
jgi:hypothetical protein